MKKCRLIEPKEYLGLTPEEKAKICNGAGSAQYFDFVPDTMWGLNMNCSANVHDFIYFKGKTRFDKILADAIYAFDMFRYIEANSNFIMSALRKNRAMTYVSMVNALGDGSFFIDEKDNTDYADEFSVDELIYKSRSLEIIKKFILLPKGKKVILKAIGKLFDYIDIYTEPGMIIRALIDDYEQRTEKRVISDYERGFQSVF